MSSTTTSGRVRGEAAQQRVGVAGLAHDVHPRLGQQPRESLAQQHVVVGDRYAHGTSATRLELSGVTESVPASACTRSSSLESAVLGGRRGRSACAAGRRRAVASIRAAACARALGEREAVGHDPVRGALDLGREASVGQRRRPRRRARCARPRLRSRSPARRCRGWPDRARGRARAARRARARAPRRRRATGPELGRGGSVPASPSAKRSATRRC